VAVVGAEHETQFVGGSGELQRRRLPFRESRAIDVDHRERRRSDAPVRLEYAHFGAVDEVAVVGVHPESYRRRDRFLALPHDFDGARMRRDAEARARLEVVEPEADVGLVERDVGAALHVRGVACRVVDRLAVDGDAHQVERVGILRLELARHALDVDALVVVALRGLVVDDLDAHEALGTLDEAGVDHVVRLNVAATLVLRSRAGERRVLEQRLLGAARARRGKPDIVTVDRSRAPVEALVPREADEAQARVAVPRDVRERAREVGRVAGGYDRLAVLERERRDPPPRGIVHAGHHLLAGVARAELRLVGQLLQGIVVPELDLDAPVECAALLVSFEASGCESPRPSLCTAAAGRPIASWTASATRCARERDSER
jgi:hypothetical protein